MSSIIQNISHKKETEMSGNQIPTIDNTYNSQSFENHTKLEPEADNDVRISKKRRKQKT